MSGGPGKFVRGLGLVAAACIAGAGIYYLGFWDVAAPDGADFSNPGPHAVKLAIIGVVLATSLVFAHRRVGEVLSAVIFWGGLAVILVTGYSMRYELETMGRNVLASLMPGMAVERGDGTVSLARDRSGHYVLDATVDCASVRFLVDTGASVVTLTAEDARAAGVDLDRLHFGAIVSTANGQAQVAPVRLSKVKIAGTTLTGVRAFVARDEALDTSLFGMNALDRFSSWRVEGRRMILTP
ncbi:TIGR02281 family clan AA aspartic protease [Breoghania sp.]|uniref:retropepsin-like aspartic protease family protein n=1 Tax=Breoghania sp. TaxID=2065378 RepID=UPI002606786B|nr:TIGR02281 family clan AA aspartic protease [Breoghania sp.]MDJ0931340.1 TIGR02281 family clan AA aspartic protease [Breoghania sp.]